MNLILGAVLVLGLATLAKCIDYENCNTTVIRNKVVFVCNMMRKRSVSHTSPPEQMHNFIEEMRRDLRDEKKFATEHGLWSNVSPHNFPAHPGIFGGYWLKNIDEVFKEHENDIKKRYILTDAVQKCCTGSRCDVEDFITVCK